MNRCAFCGSYFTMPPPTLSQCCQSCWLEIQSKRDCAYCHAPLRGFIHGCGICGLDCCADSNCWSLHYNDCMQNKLAKDANHGD